MKLGHFTFAVSRLALPFFAAYKNISVINFLLLYSRDHPERPERSRRAGISTERSRGALNAQGHRVINCEIS